MGSCRSGVVVILLLNCCLVCFPLVVWVLCLSLFYCALLCVIFSFQSSWKGNLLGKGWPLGSRLCCLTACHFPIGILDQVWCLIVSIPDLCTLTYSVHFAFIVLRMSCYCKCSVTLPHGAVGWSAVCVCGISWSYSLIFVGGRVSDIASYLCPCCYLAYIVPIKNRGLLGTFVNAMWGWTNNTDTMIVFRQGF